MWLEFLLKRGPVRMLRAGTAIAAAGTFIARRACAVRTLGTVIVLCGIAFSAAARNKRAAPFPGTEPSPTKVGLSRRMAGRIILSGTLEKRVEFFFQKYELVRDLLDLSG